VRANGSMSPLPVRDATDAAEAAPEAAASPQPALDVAPPLTRVLIVDDHRSFAEALVIAIDQLDDMCSIAAVASVSEAVACFESAPPDVVLMDIRLPDGDGIELTGRIRASWPDARVVILTGHTDVDVLARAATAGASGFLPKESSIGAVIRAIRTARSGEMLVEGTTLAAILGRVASPAAATGRAGGESVVLTPREQDVLLLMGQGMDPHAIAASLGISLHTCRGYQKAIMGKLGAHSQLEVVIVAARRGLLPRVAG
jgi:DNA-binding NarL/FixJ family response regulator